MVDTQKLKELAIWLDGLNTGKGDLLPLGKNHLDELWKAIKVINLNKL